MRTSPRSSAGCEIRLRQSGVGGRMRSVATIRPLACESLGDPSAYPAERRLRLGPEGAEVPFQCVVTARLGGVALEPDYDSDPGRWGSWRPVADVDDVIGPELRGPVLDVDVVTVASGVEPEVAWFGVDQLPNTVDGARPDPQRSPATTTSQPTEPATTHTTPIDKVPGRSLMPPVLWYPQPCRSSTAPTAPSAQSVACHLMRRTLPIWGPSPNHS